MTAAAETWVAGLRKAVDGLPEKDTDLYALPRSELARRLAELRSLVLAAERYLTRAEGFTRFTSRPVNGSGWDIPG